MTPETAVALDSRWPLTCSRSGACCHGQVIRVNPWELACLAGARGLPAREFRDRYTVDGGTCLRMDGPPGWQARPACRQFAPGSGCLAHPGRPLACRLYPLGRRRRPDGEEFFFRGSVFPCRESCPEVEPLPHLTVSEYLTGQGIAPGVAAQEAYLEIMAELAEGALVVLLESGLAASGDRTVLRGWRKLATLSPSRRAQNLPPGWLDRLTIPELTVPPESPAAFAQAHHRLLQEAAQAAFGALTAVPELRRACATMMSLALHLGTCLSLEPAPLVERWIASSTQHGARE